MKIYKTPGSKERLFEMFQNVNKVKLHEDFANNNLAPQSNNLRGVTVHFSNGKEITTSVAAHLTDDEILNYYAVGKRFNIGNSGNDDVQSVTSVDILPDEGTMGEGRISPLGAKYTHFAIDKATKKIVNGWEYGKDIDRVSIAEYAKMDLIDQFPERKPSEFVVVTRQYLEKQGIDPSDTNNWYKIDGTAPVNELNGATNDAGEPLMSHSDYNKYSEPSEPETDDNGGSKKISSSGQISSFNNINWRELFKIFGDNGNVLNELQSVNDSNRNALILQLTQNNDIYDGGLLEPQDMNLLSDADIVYIDEGVAYFDNPEYSNFDVFYNKSKSVWDAVVKGTYKSSSRGGNDSEAPHLRGYEPMSEEEQQAIKLIDEMPLLRNLDKIDMDKYKYVAVHLWDSLTSGVKIALFLQGKRRDTGEMVWYLSTKNPIIFVKEKFFQEPDVAYLQGQAAKQFLAEHGYKIKEPGKSLMRIAPTAPATKPTTTQQSPEQQVPEENPVNETTDQERYEDVVYLQGDEAFQPLELLDSKGPEAALEYLKQWHYPGEHMGRNELSHGTSDKTFEKDGYIMSWNAPLSYIGLQYDTQHISETINEDKEIYKRVPKEKNKESMEAIKKSNARKEKLKKSVTKTLNEDDIESAESDTENPSSIDNVLPQFLNKKETGDQIPGGLADNAGDQKFSLNQIRKGLKTELEHTDDPFIALEITSDHLIENPAYYGGDGQDPEQAAQCNAMKDVGGDSVNSPDKQETDILLGFKPHNVGDSIEEYDNFNYPAGADADPRAPWHEKEQPDDDDDGNPEPEGDVYKDRY